MLSSVDVHNFLQERDIPHEIFKLPQQLVSLERAAAALGLELDKIVRSEVFRIDGEPVMLIIPGDRSVDFEKVRRVTGCEEIEELSPEELTRLTGFLPKALPPFPVKLPMRTFVDFYVLREDVVYAGSGDQGSILKIRSYDLVRAAAADTVDITNMKTTEG